MSPDGSETEDRADEHPILVFVIVATIAVGLLLLLASVASGDDGSRGRPPPPEAGTPAGGGSGAELPEAAAADKAPLSGSPATAAASTAASDPIHPDAPPPAVSARAYAIIERGCGQLSFGWNEHERLAPASLTKIFTALVVARTANLDDQVAVQVSGKQMKAQGSSVMGIEPGQQYSVRDLLYGLMLPSGNDAALALAQHIGGGEEERFVAMMNGDARQLGLTNTQFTNPHGLDHPELYSSAYDMAIAGRAALDISLLHDVSNTLAWTTASGLSFKNGNKLLATYPGVSGVKIGFTTAAKQTLVAAADRGGRQVVISVLGSDNRYADAAALLDWTFDHLKPRC